MASTRKPNRPNQGEDVIRDRPPPHSSGSGPYGAGVCRQRGLTACRIGPCRTAGVATYGESRRATIIPLATCSTRRR